MPPLNDVEHHDQRIENTTGNGKPYDHQTIRSVWEKAVRQPGFETISMDHHGTSISLFEYGRQSTYGWVIERIVPLDDGGTDEISNLRPLHWKHLRGENT